MSLPTKPIKKMKNLEHIEYFKQWLQGKNLPQIAESAGKSVQYLRKLSAVYGWRNLRTEVIESRYMEIVSGHKMMAVKMYHILNQDLNKFVTDLEKEKDRKLTEDERSYLLKLYDRILKEIRLEDGVPTDLNPNGGANITVNLRVPEGVKYLEAIPPIGSGEVTTVKKGTVETKTDPEDYS